MPSSGWLAALTRHFTRAPTLLHPHSSDCGRSDGNGIRTVSSQAFHNGSRSYGGAGGGTAPPSRPTTPWSLDTLDEEIRRYDPRSYEVESNDYRHHKLKRRSSSAHSKSGNILRSSSAPSTRRMEGDINITSEREISSASAQGGYPSRPQSAASRPPSASSRPSSAASRPPSAASRLSAPAQPLLRSHTQAQTTSVGGPTAHLPAQGSVALFTHYVHLQVDDADFGETYYDYDDMDSRGHYFIPPVIPPLYDRPVAAPTPMSTRCNTPVWDNDQEKRVRFLEPEVVGENPSRPPSVSSQYSHVLKNSTRFAFQPPQDMLDSTPHNPRHCNCPCHFFPCGRRSVGVQVKRTDPPDPRPKHYRLFLTPTTRGLDQVTLGSKSLNLAARALLSQVGLLIVVLAWWVAGAAIFSAVEGSAESETVNNMATLRTDLVLGLATELRQVRPYDVVWRTKIESYMGRLETAVLDAARAGYASRAPIWTMSGALLYSASLTTLVGPGGMTLRTGFSRLFAVLFSLIGAPLVLLLAISGALTIREGVGKAWAWRCGRGNQSRVGDGHGNVAEGRAGQYGSGRSSSARSTLNLASRPQSSASVNLGETSLGITPNGPGGLPGSLDSARPRSQGGASELPQQSRVPVLESTLRASTSSTPRDNDRSSTGSGDASSSAINAQTTSRGSGGGGDGGGGGGNGGEGNGDEGLTPKASSSQRKKPGYPFYPLQPPPRRKNNGHAAPWGVYLAILVLYLILGLVIFAPVQRWSLPSAIYILTGTLLTLDHGGLGEKQLLGSSKIIVPYVLYMLLGTVIVATLVISVWSSICSSLVSTGKYLTVVRPTDR
ncbi:hypothetical protein SK128_018429 [Halocaridina rubra]|uniref:Potassium channel domain-containing protein n=1 Tax=Halocaridina rubra TaxID=373956 RepID=A0AAN9A9T7_HALRR